MELQVDQQNGHMAQFFQSLQQGGGELKVQRICLSYKYRETADKEQRLLITISEVRKLNEN